jgi:hypothetical protein
MRVTELEWRIAAADAAADRSAIAASALVAEIVETYKAEREADWQKLLTGPLEAAVHGLTTEHEACALEEIQGRWIKDVMARFARLFSDVHEAVRHCNVQYGLDVVIDTLATADIPPAIWSEARHEGFGREAEVRRRFADLGHELVRPYRSPFKRDRRWVV